MSKHKINVYTCEECGGFTVTIDIDEGVTPFMLRCRAPQFMGGACDGWGQSGFYKPRADVPAPAWEWYAPDAAELATMDEAMADHCRNGGLNIRARALAAAVPVAVAK